MNKKVILIIICFILLIFILVYLGVKKLDRKQNNIIPSIINKEERDVNYDSNIKGSPIETLENITIQGIVEVKHNGYIYIFNGQHFGEYGLEMNEYTRTNIDDKKQKCIDYITSKEYDTNYIKEGDLLICKGDLIKYNSYVNDDFDTKDNEIIVLKEADFDKMKKEALKDERNATITVEEYFDKSSLDESNEIYLKYEITDNGYKLPFALKFNFKDDIKISGKLEKGKKVKVQYKDLNEPLDRLELKAIEVLD